MDLPLIVIVPAVPVPEVDCAAPSTVVLPTTATTLDKLVIRLIAAALAIALPELEA